jgi:hypothetical protein
MIRRARHGVACLLRTALVSLLIVPLLAGAQDKSSADKTSAKAFKPEELEQIVAPMCGLRVAHRKASRGASCDAWRGSR